MLRFYRLLALLTFSSLTASAQSGAPALPPPAPLPAPSAAATKTAGSSSPAVTTPPAVGTAAPERFLQLFRPFRTDSAALSPDGKLLAYSIRENDNLFVLIVEVDNPAKVRSKVLVGTAETSSPTLQSDAKELIPPRIRWMGWATPTRLVIETNANLASASGGNWTNTSGALFAVDADGTHGRTLVTPRDVEETDLKFNDPPTTPDPNKINTPDVAVDLPSSASSSGFGDDIGSGDGALTASTDNLPLDARTPRSPTFFDYKPGEPDWIIVRTSDPKNYGLFDINIQTGKLRYDSKEVMAEEVTPLIDRQGHQSAAVASTTRTAFPHPYLLQKKFGLGRWNELGKIAKIPAVKFSVSPENYMGERSFPIGFDENPDVLYYASNVGRDTYGIYGLNTKTGEAAGKPIESATLDLVDPAPNGFLSPNPLVFDRYTRQLIGIRYQKSINSAIWLTPEFREVQHAIETALPGRSVDITGWDENRNRFLALVQGPTDSGGFYVFDRGSQKLSEFVRCAPWGEGDNKPVSISFTFPNPAGGTLSGVIVIPRAVRQKPIPIVVLCADEPWLRAPADFNNELNALGAMGFAVVQLNPRGAWGFGIKHREAAKDAFDEVQVADIVTTIDQLSKGMPLNPKRVALFGHDRGGYLAFRALQLRPDRFRCAIGIEPTIDLAGWLAETRWTSGDSGPALTRSFFGDKILKQNALMDAPKSVTKPIFVGAYRGIDGAPPSQRYLTARTFSSHVETPDVPVKFFDLSTDYMRGLPGARSEVMRNVEDFLNENIYAYNVKLGETTIEGSAPTPPPAKK